MAKIGGNKDHIITLRVTEEDYDILRISALTLGYSKASGNSNTGEFIRYLMRASIRPLKTELRKRGITAHEAYESLRNGVDMLQSKTEH